MAAGDNYCAGCGRLALQLAIQPESVILVSSLPSRQEQTLVLWNQDPQDLHVEIRQDPESAWLSHGKSSSLVIKGGQKANVPLRLDPDKLPKDFRQLHTLYHLILNQEGNLRRTVEVTVRSGPRPVAAAVSFGELSEGKRGDQVIHLANEGGLALRVTAIDTKGTRQLGVGKVGLPISVESGQSVEIPVFWDTSIESEEDGTDAGFLLQLADKQIFQVSAQANLYRYRLEPAPRQVRFEGSAKRVDAIPVEIRNRGSIDVEVKAVRAPAKWLKVLSPPILPRTLSAIEGTQVSDKSLLSFTLGCEPQGLEPGTHQGFVEIVTAQEDLDNVRLPVELLLHELTPYPDYVGIDFGTTNSVVSVLGSDLSPELVEVPGPNGEGPSGLIPSLLYFHPDGTTRIGHDALEASRTFPERMVPSIKRLMGYDEALEILGKSYRPEEIAAHILRHLVAFAEQRLLETRRVHYDVQRAIISVPANFFDLQIQGILEACERAGIATERDQVEAVTARLRELIGTEINAGIILDEPSAAAFYFLHYLSDQRSLKGELQRMIGRKRGLNLLVYDHGGGTLDISVAQATRLEDASIGLKILATKGNNLLGGDHLDVVLMADLLASAQAAEPLFDTTLVSLPHRQVVDRRKAEQWPSATWQEVYRARRDWKEYVEKLKIRLSREDPVSEKLPASALGHVEKGRYVRGGKSVRLELSRQNLEELLGPTLDQALSLVTSALSLAQIKADNIDFVLHGGRQSLMGAVQDKVAELFPKALEAGRIFLEEDLLKTCVAKGALKFGQLRHRAGGTIRLVQEHRLPHAYGWVRFDPLGTPEFETIIPSGEIYPLERERVLSASELDLSGRLQRKLLLNLGTAIRIKGNPDIHEVGNLDYSFDLAKTQEIRVLFTLDANRRLTVMVGDQTIDIKPLRPAEELHWMG